MSKANQDELGELHGALARHFKQRLASGEITASELGVIRQFLKDNGIEALATKGSDMGDLLDGLDSAEIIQLEERIGSR